MPYFLVIEAISPDRPMPNQTITVHFRLINFRSASISGDVRGEIDGVRLIGTVSSNVRNLTLGTEITGELWTYGRPAGTHVAHIEFADGVLTGTPGSGFNPFDPRPIPHPLGQAPVVAEDAQEFVVGAPDPTLTSTDYPGPFTPDWHVCGDEKQEFGFSPDVLYEWGSVAPDPATITPAVGTVVATHEATADFPFAHPFGFDANTYVVPDPDWMPLLSCGNKPSLNQCATDSNYEDVCHAQGFAPPDLKEKGVLVVETDQGFLPRNYRPLPGERVAVHGTWIVDCGHKDHHAEIHPPLLTARAGVNAAGQLRATFLGRPYTVKQTYEPDSAPFLPHALGQIAAAIASPGPATVSVRPQIADSSFSGTISAHYTLALPPTAGSGFLDSAVHYHFVKRPGVAVSVLHRDKYHVDVTITLDEATYVPPPHPVCQNEPLTPDEIDKLWGQPSGSVMKILGATGSGVPAPVLDFLGTFIGIPPPTFTIAAAKTAAALSRGIDRTTCTLPEPPAPPVAPSVEGGDNQTVCDVNLPYPVAGWVVMTWTPNRAVMLSARGLRAYRAAEIAPGPH
jgi:hypothetical protein